MGCTPRAHILPTDFSCLGIYQNVNAVYLFKSREGINKPISRSMAYKILRAAAEYVGLDDIGTHAEENIRVPFLQANKRCCHAAGDFQPL